MKTIIAGSRHVRSYLAVCDAVRESGFTITEVVSGKEPNGVDALGERWANDHGIPVKDFPAYWTEFGLSAGPRRNGEMAEYADALVAVWDGVSSGTRDMIAKAKRRGLKVFVYRWDG